jgi:hypothetical protein
LYDYLLGQARAASPNAPAKVYFRHSAGEAEGGYSVLFCTPGRGPGDEYFALKISNWPRTPRLDENEPLRWGIGEDGLRQIIIPLLNRLGGHIVPESEVGLWRAVFSEEPRSTQLDLALAAGESFDLGIVQELIGVIRFLLSKEEFTRKRKRLTPQEKSNLLVRDPKFISESLESLLNLIQANQTVLELGLSVLREEGYYPSLQTFVTRESK